MRSVGPPLRYDRALISSLPPEAAASAVAQFCTRPEDSWAGAYATLTEKWFADLAPSNVRLRRRLCSPDDNMLWGAWWELAAARFFAGRGLDVEIEPSIGGKTPDLRISSDDGMVLVEVLRMNPSAATEAEQQRLTRVERQLNELVDLDTGVVALVMLAVLDRDPTPDQVRGLAESLRTWLATDPGQPFLRDQGSMRAHAAWMPGSPSVISVSPSARFIGDVGRVRARIGQKLAKYADLPVTTPLVLFVALDHWTMTAQSVVDALLGSEQVVFDLNDVCVNRLRHSGDGALVLGGPGGYEGSRITSGAIAAQRQRVSDEPPSCSIRVDYIHNPYSERPLSNDWFHPYPEYQASGTQMGWVRREGTTMAVLD